MADHRLPPRDFLHECFSYDPETGVFRWKARPAHHFDNEAVAKAWNGKMAGTLAFQQVDKGYARCEVRHAGKRYRLQAHCVAYKMMTGEEHEMIDHRDLDTRNDRFSNLRASDRFKNRWNAPGMRTHSLPKGVTFERGRFCGLGRIGQRRVRLGMFSTPAEAHKAYCDWARPLHGEFFNPGTEKPSVFD